MSKETRGINNHDFLFFVSFDCFIDKKFDKWSSIKENEKIYKFLFECKLISIFLFIWIKCKIGNTNYHNCTFSLIPLNRIRSFFKCASRLNYIISYDTYLP